MTRRRRRSNKGDIMSAAKRSALMSRIRGRDTKPELLVACAFRALGLRFRRHVGELPGRPDFVFVSDRVVVFVDGDFWHGWRLPAWRHKLSQHWEAKISANRARDARNRRMLQRRGWTVIRLWEHQVEANLGTCVGRVRAALAVGPRCG